MKNLSFFLFLGLILVGTAVLVIADTYAAKNSTIFSKGDHCVAYRVKKRLLLIRKVTVVGKNCELTAQMVPELEGNYSFELRIPVSKFDSGETERDRDVVKVLRADKQADLLFKSAKYSKEEWQKMILKVGAAEIKGQLTIAGRTYPITSTAKFIKGKEGMEVEGVVYTRFNHFGLKPPELVGGLMAKVRPDLELHFHLQSEKTLGMMAILE